MGASGLAALVLGILRLLVDLFIPIQKESARAVHDLAAPDSSRLAVPSRLRAFRPGTGDRLGADGDAGPDRG